MSLVVKSFAEEPFLPFAKPCISEETIEDLAQCIRSGWLTTGPRVQEFEAALRDYLQVPHALAVSSATAGLHLALLALDLEKGDEVITPSLTFAATANVIVQAGGKPVFVDSDPQTYNLDLNQVERGITPRTKVIMPVHFGGYPVDLGALYALADKHGLRVVEDAAHTIGATYKGKKIGSFGDIQVFSFHPNKNMTTGEGGCITTRDDGLAKRLQALRFHGIDREAWNRFSKKGSQVYDVVEPGFKANMMDMQAILGIHQLKELDTFIERRTQLARRYQEHLADWKEIELPTFSSDGYGHAWHFFNPLIMAMDRNTFIDAMKERNIGLGLHYLPVHLFSYYQKAFGYKTGDFPIAEKIGFSIVSLPLFPTLTLAEQDRVIAAMSDILKVK